jgi:sec-independent protein translocase protein TatB
MFEINWSELLILAVVTLICVGPKDLPKFLNTMGRYAGMVRRQAAEFRAQFDEAMRQAELDALKKEVNEVRADIETSVRDAQSEKSVVVAGPPPVQPMLPLGRSAEEIKSTATADAAPASPPDHGKGA